MMNMPTPQQQMQPQMVLQQQQMFQRQPPEPQPVEAPFHPVARLKQLLPELRFALTVIIWFGIGF